MISSRCWSLYVSADFVVWKPRHDIVVGYCPSIPDHDDDEFCSVKSLIPPITNMFFIRISRTTPFSPPGSISLNLNILHSMSSCFRQRTISLNIVLFHFQIMPGFYHFRHKKVSKRSTYHSSSYQDELASEPKVSFWFDELVDYLFYFFTFQSKFFLFRKIVWCFLRLGAACGNFLLHVEKV